MLFEIKPAQAYPDDYDTCEAHTKKEPREGYQPELAENCDIAPYSTILLGTPNWFNTMAPPVAAFLAAHDFTGKTILLCGAAVQDGLEVYEGGLTAAGEKPPRG
ncbi:hypothetical protein [uncultured Desulfovibrio sp.]|mgnify:FL=1|uniref:hypothetical protein n=1 Tax=uncultured Desulfovibrio sp. TaxID=167968 RepID=UPI002605EA56|nr:hypothetical protein [uncultured Desulfovibrio sp.]